MHWFRNLCRNRYFNYCRFNNYGIRRCTMCMRHADKYTILAKTIKEISVVKHNCALQTLHLVQMSRNIRHFITNLFTIFLLNSMYPSFYHLNIIKAGRLAIKYINVVLDKIYLNLDGVYWLIIFALLKNVCSILTVELFSLIKHNFLFTDCKCLTSRFYSLRGKKSSKIIIVCNKQFKRL